MQQLEFTAELRDRRTYRSLKIEADGDGWAGKIKPKIRLKGNWLERAGFKAGGRVKVTSLTVGVMELRCEDVGSRETCEEVRR
ncbi:MAG TPA: SymE family type I addiction module toxin [Candidatus Angelobacter sp.]|nr:SymE family type I addiction module toxin [Candidatus Angelobacter sp.]